MLFYILRQREMTYEFRLCFHCRTQSKIDPHFVTFLSVFTIISRVSVKQWVTTTYYICKDFRQNGLYLSEETKLNG